MCVQILWFSEMEPYTFSICSLKDTMIKHTSLVKQALLYSVQFLEENSDDIVVQCRTLYGKPKRHMSTEYKHITLSTHKMSNLWISDYLL